MGISQENDLDKQILETQERKKQLAKAGYERGIPLDTAFNGISMDQEFYSRPNRDEYDNAIEFPPATDMDDVNEDDGYSFMANSRDTNHEEKKRKMIYEAAMMGESHDPFANRRIATIGDKIKEGSYKRKPMLISPPRIDPFANGGKTPDVDARTHTMIMREQGVQKDEALLLKRIHGKTLEGGFRKEESVKQNASKRKRWDETPKEKESWDSAKTPAHGQWAETPSHVSSRSVTPSAAATPGSVRSRRNRWDDMTPKTETPGRVKEWTETPRADQNGDKEAILDTPGSSRKRTRWDESPMVGSQTPMTPRTPVFTPGGSTPMGARAMALATPSSTHAMMAHQKQVVRADMELEIRNRPLSDDDLDMVLPSEGFRVVPPPASYKPTMTPARKLMATPTPMGGYPTGFQMPAEGTSSVTHLFPDHQPKGNLPSLREEDMQFFSKLLTDVDESSLNTIEQKERKIMKLILKIKNGTPPMRKSALRQITDNAREFGPEALFNQILPLLMSSHLQEQERHLLIKIIDRVLYKLDDLVRPFVHKLLVVLEPLLIDDDYYARVEGREAVSNLAKAAGLASMITVLRPDIDNADEFVRNTTARTFAVVAASLGIPSLLPFLKAVCRSKKSWEARHTGVKIVQQISILVGCAVLPYLKDLVETIKDGLVDKEPKVTTITAHAIAALAEAATPYGIESFEDVITPLWKGINRHRGKCLGAFLKAMGYLIPLMTPEQSSVVGKRVLAILIREFQSPDEEVRKTVLVIVKQICGTDGIEPSYIREEVLTPFFKSFWNQRLASDKRTSAPLVATTVDLANKVGASEIISRVAEHLIHESESFKKMNVETIGKIMQNLGATDIDSRLEETLIDKILYVYQTMAGDDRVLLEHLGVIFSALGARSKPYLHQITAIFTDQLNDKSPKVRQIPGELLARTAGVWKQCGEEDLLTHLGKVMYENLGEEFPETLGSILGALKSIVNVLGTESMDPPIKDLLPRLTPVLKNRHERVQENCIDLVGRIADRGAEHVSAKEWMRICFELLELLKAHKKAIRRATVNTFGYIAKAIGPHDVLATLLNNLRVQERQNRVCTTVAIAIVAETCSPFTVLPALMNEYSVPDLNVQTGVLKALSFLFEYIGEVAKDYVYAVTPLLEDALQDRDLVHRQTACATVQHLALGLYGLGEGDDAMGHLLNSVWPNIFETSPHLVQAFMGAVEALGFTLGPIRLLQYVAQGLFHPARKVREVFWIVYNKLYINGQAALVAGYPPLAQYPRHELDYMI